MPCKFTQAHGHACNAHKLPCEFSCAPHDGLAFHWLRVTRPVTTIVLCCFESYHAFGPLNVQLPMRSLWVWFVVRCVVLAQVVHELHSSFIMAWHSFKTHIQALKAAKQGTQGGLLKHDDTQYMEGTILTGSSASTFVSALPPPSQPLSIQPLQIITPPAPVPETHLTAIKEDVPPARKKTQVSTS